MTKWLTLLILLISSNVYADTLKTIHAEWEFGGIATSYRLYKEGVLVGESFDTAKLAMDVELWLPDTGKVSFTMTAVGPYGETPHSAPFILDMDNPIQPPPDIVDTEPITPPIIDPTIPSVVIAKDEPEIDPIVISIEFPIVILRVTYNWEYTGDMPLGFKIFHNNVGIATVGPDIREYTVTFQPSFSNDNVFAVKAYDTDGEYQLGNELKLPKYNLIDTPKNIRIE